MHGVASERVRVPAAQHGRFNLDYVMCVMYVPRARAPLRFSAKIWHLPANVNGENFCCPDCARAGGTLTRRLVAEAGRAGGNLQAGNKMK